MINISEKILRTIIRNHGVECREMGGLDTRIASFGGDRLTVVITETQMAHLQLLNEEENG